ncbi:PQQ-dependent sugar dehydrogenase [Stenotrophomonas sp. C3(2023)]|uniref:PQQ-dependent sugar dehydrogenase n=1 Tax=Stenotrophomonas sp. C3(2023) TaxID=3080277 RepID=UPI00293C3865|nr:PQQ-dependent sugar dehydrogenase [Stenotrophomonas sp. C3(2023)]MDV3470214.1 PQQ-dependent sugar dehydrogenase [Stenotrophomonas sp. C3(2023)]
MTRKLLLTLAIGLTPALLTTTACSASGPDTPVAAGAAKAAEDKTTTQPGWTFNATEVARFDEPWAMTFLPDGSLLVTEKRGRLQHYNVATGARHEITGGPKVAYGGQGGMGDVLLHPDFANNGWVYLSYAEEGSNDTRGAAVARAKLVLADDGSGELQNMQVIWRQEAKVSGRGHYGHRLAFGPDGKLWITSSERQKFDPAQDMSSNLGKLIRLNDDGSVPDDNPFAGQGGVAAQVWSLGHRNALGIAFDAQGRLWVHEMGPAGGDELNLIERGANYGYPIVSNGDHYDGRKIPDHSTRPEFNAPKITWNPVISPAGFLIYNGSLFPQWQGSGFIGGLSSQALVRVAFDGENAREAERFDMGARIREVEQGPDGAVWVLEDGKNAKLLKLTPKG